jgi:hypothetical protein
MHPSLFHSGKLNHYNARSGLEPGSGSVPKLLSGSTEDWLSGMDSNHDKELQRLLCYHYTTGQTGGKIACGLGGRKADRQVDRRLNFGGKGLLQAGFCDTNK